MPLSSQPVTLRGVLVSALFLTVAHGGQPDPKQLEAQARQLTSEGKALEQQGRLAEAKDKYVDAEGLSPGSEAQSAIRRINEQQEQQVESLLAQAHRLFDAGKLADSAASLEQALAIQPARPVLHYDLALCYLKLGDRTNAALHLDPAIALLGGKERGELLELRSAVLMGSARAQAAPGAGQGLSAFNDSYLREDRESQAPQASAASLCSQSNQLLTTYPANPAVLFNSAKCATQQARAADATRLLADYVRQAPDALDQGDAAAAQQEWSSLASLPDSPGQAVREHYAAAGRYLDYRRYNLAIAEYTAAAAIAPDFAQTQWELAVLHEAQGDSAQAAKYFESFGRLGPPAERETEAELHLSSLERRRATYEARISEARAILSGLLRTSLGIDSEGTRHSTRLTYLQWRWASRQYKQATRATTRLSSPYVVRELGRAHDALLAAVVLFPLGAEANELLALIELQGYDWPEAYLSYDAVASQGLPVSFYGQVTSTRDAATVHAAKIEILADAVRIIYLAWYDTDKQVSAPPSRPAGTDALGNLVLSAGESSDAQAEELDIRAADLKGIETEQNFVVLKLDGAELHIAPLELLADVPFALGAARSFGNAYTRLFARYLGYTDAKLGPEGLSAGETFRVGLLIATAAMPVGMLGTGAGAAYASAVRTARLGYAAAHARGAARLAQVQRTLQSYQSIAQDLRLARAGGATSRVAVDRPLDAETLERTAADQRRSLEGLVFKVIPTGARVPAFRDSF
jgi:tetratricopeptide (TPR) repeat protein